MYLLKTEPSAYSYADLERDGRTTWDGVTNPTALRNMRAAQVGDLCFIYHTGDEKAAVGVSRVLKAAYPDPKSKNPRLVVIDLAAVAYLARPVTLAEMKAMPVFAESPLVRQGRLSIVPLTQAQWTAIEKAGAGK